MGTLSEPQSMAYRLAATGGVHPQTLKHHDYWHRVRTIRQGIVIAVMIAFATGVFAGAIRVMSPGSPVHWTAATSPAVQYDDDFDDDAAFQNKPESPLSD